MRKIHCWIFMILALCGSLFLAACSGGGGGDTTPPAGKLYIAGGDAKTIFAFASANTISGNVAPTSEITGTNTQLNGPYGIAYDSRSDSIIVGNVYGNNVLIFDNVSTMNGDVAPTRTITGLDSPEDIAIDQDRNLLYVTVTHGVAVFANASTVNGSAAPVSLITGTATGFSGDADKRLFLDTKNNRLYVTDPGSFAVMIFDNISTLNGEVAPNRIISSTTPTFDFIWGIAVDVSRDLLYVSDQNTKTITVFANASTASGNIAPTRTIGGAATTMNGPSDIYIDSAADILYVADAFGDQVLIWNSASTIDGNIAPSRSIVGANTGLFYPGDLVLVQ